MENSEVLGIVRVFFLEKENEVLRHEYALSQPLVLHELLMEAQVLFYQHSVGSEEIIKFLDRHNLSSVKNDFAKIQKEFYLTVYDSAEESENIEDDKKLIETANPSYEFLKNDERFEKELETTLRHNNRLSNIREKVNRLEARRVKTETEGKDNDTGTRVIPIGQDNYTAADRIPIESYPPAAAASIGEGGRSHKLWISSLAAAVLLIVMVWQPFHESNNDLYSAYISKNKAITSSDVTIYGNGVRGKTNSLFVGLSEIEKGKAAEALSFFQEGQYNKAKQILEELNVSRNDSSQLLIFLAISQLHVNDIEKAKRNLDTVKSSTNIVQHDDASFYLALYYLKTDERDEARKTLEQLENNSEKYRKDAKTILQKLRWF